MLILNPDGYCRGDRTAECERMSWLYFPSIFLCANGYGRFEVNYGRIAHQIGVHAPTEAEFEACIQEYARVHLLFLYRVGVKRWGQWDADKRFLPRWKTAEDKRSPFPPEPDYTNWLKEYHGSESKGLPKDSEDSGGFLGNSDSSCRSSRVVEVGVDVKTLCSSDDEPGVETIELIPPKPKPADQVLKWFDGFWELYPRKVAKPKALAAARRHGKTDADRTAIMECLKRRLPALQGQFKADGDYRPYPASWLNQTPWLDGAEVERPAAVPRIGGKGSNVIDEAMRLYDARLTHDEGKSY